MMTAGTHGCARCAALEQQFEQFYAQIAQLQAQVAQLQSELAAAKKNSSNSSKPPSSDIVKKPKDKPKHGGKRKPGGQPGHQRHERPAFPPDRVDQSFDFVRPECPDCHGPVVPSKLPPKVIQQIELVLPSEMIRVVEFRSQACWCRKCKQVHYGVIDEAVRRASLIGPRLTTLIAYLKSVCHCSYSTVRKFIRDECSCFSNTHVKLPCLTSSVGL
jgi:transposase